MGRAIGLPGGDYWLLQPFFSELGGTFGGLDCEEFGSVALVGCGREEAVECTT